MAIFLIVIAILLSEKFVDKKRRSGERYNPHRVFTGIFIPEALVKIPVKKLSFGAKMCFGRLCRYAGKDGIAFPKRETLAKEIGSSERAVDRFIVELKKFGLIKVERKGLHKSNRYYFVWHEVFDKAEESDASPNSPKVATQNLTKVATPIERESDGSESEENKSKYHCNASVAENKDSFSESKAGGSEINKVIALFKKKHLFKRKTERDSADRLLKKHGYDKLKVGVEFAVLCGKIRNRGSNIETFAFLPDVSTPYRLENNMEKLLGFHSRLKIQLEKKHTGGEEADMNYLLSEEIKHPERNLVMDDMDRAFMKIERAEKNSIVR